MKLRTLYYINYVFEYLPLKCLFQSFAFFYFSCLFHMIRSSFCIWSVNPLSITYQLPFLPCGSLIHIINKIFCWKQVLNFHVIYLINFLLWLVLLVFYLSSLCYSKIMTTWPFIFRSAVYLELIFLCGMRKNPSFIVFHMDN